MICPNCEADMADTEFDVGDGETLVRWECECGWTEDRIVFGDRE